MPDERDRRYRRFEHVQIVIMKVTSASVKRDQSVLREQCALYCVYICQCHTALALKVFDLKEFRGPDTVSHYPNSPVFSLIGFVTACQFSCQSDADI